ncbi:hypothetical protein PQH03_28335 [Ralstonia insidiosa]|jgi:hypothetical protein|uniref:Uncharacterized protein n=1 Tax=Ralstonia insidiosa TaxID=190721 RepID=A0A192A835_9RALS|nr:MULTISPECIES: hypothetical protein [Ralstonia]KMW44145.1 hypothetical protein AC240_26770 [Ralstonia sp. MD27]ANJ76544.1 hypothetical protein A9Y76_28580 [Ralstonia insidiosa]MBA9869591.1 hypothetical protein [Ralstonia insidiosa]MBA9885211.1 hypothetical protein [Ralstonia pickettii]MBA9894990.1 hypothetical protein [Ralstonia pickettii]
MLTNCPERVFLQIGDDCPRDADFEALKHVTWCAHSAGGGDIEYLRADAVAAAVFKVLADVEALACARNAPELAGFEMALEEVRARLGTSELQLTEMLGEQATARESQAVIAAYLSHASAQVLPSGPEILKALWGGSTEPSAEEVGDPVDSGPGPQAEPMELTNDDVLTIFANTRGTTASDYLLKVAKSIIERSPSAETPVDSLTWAAVARALLASEGASASELIHGAAKHAAFPSKCPITRRDFFMVLEHPELGLLPTYGGPLDSYTIPEMEGEPTEELHERSLFVHRYDHDRGEWVDDESINLRVIEESVLHELQQTAPISCCKGHEANAAATSESIPAQRANAEALQKLFEIFGVGPAARTLPILLANAANAQRRSLCLAAVERAFFTVESESDEGTDEPGEECQLNWGAEPEAYIEQFRSELQHLIAKTLATRRNNAASLEALDIPGLRSAIRMFTPNMRDWIGKVLDRLEAVDKGDADWATVRSGSEA